MIELVLVLLVVVLVASARWLTRPRLAISIGKVFINGREVVPLKGGVPMPPPGRYWVAVRPDGATQLVPWVEP